MLSNTLPSLKGGGEAEDSGRRFYRLARLQYQDASRTAIDQSYVRLPLKPGLSYGLSTPVPVYFPRTLLG